MADQLFPGTDFGIARLVSQNKVMVFSKSSCCMCHTIKCLFRDIGVNFAVHELDQDPNERGMERVLLQRYGSNPAVPAVFIEGRLLGGANEIMAHHLRGTLVTSLRRIGATCA